MCEGSDLSLLGQVAIHMRVVLDARGWQEADQPIYRQFQAVAVVAGILAEGSGINGGVDGLPGFATMDALKRVLRGIGLPPPKVAAPLISFWGIRWPPPVDEEPLAQEAMRARIQQECEEAR